MAEGSLIHVLAAVRLQSLSQFREHLSKDPQLKLTLVTEENEAREVLANPHQRTDVFVVDNSLGGIFEMVKELRLTYPRLLIILVDQEADFGMPGHADEVCVEPFENDDLLKRIKRLNEERSLETLRADALPPVRSFAKSLRRAGPGQAKTQAAVEAIKELGYDYVAFYTIIPTLPPELRLSSQVGPDNLMSVAPQQQDYNSSLLGWVSQNGQSRIVGPEDPTNHPFVKQQRFRSGVCVPVGTTLRFGVIFACREQLSAITQQNVLMLELVSAQLASALAKQARS
jgi:GAF domain-containing protein